MKDTTYTATTVNFNEQGEMLENVRDFPKCREGLTAALDFVRGSEEWMIWFGDELVDHSN